MVPKKLTKAQKKKKSKLEELLEMEDVDISEDRYDVEVIESPKKSTSLNKTPPMGSSSSSSKNRSSLEVPSKSPKGSNKTAPKGSVAASPMQYGKRQRGIPAEERTIDLHDKEISVSTKGRSSARVRGAPAPNIALEDVTRNRQSLEQQPVVSHDDVDSDAETDTDDEMRTQRQPSPQKSGTLRGLLDMEPLPSSASPKKRKSRTVDFDEDDSEVSEFEGDGAVSKKMKAMREAPGKKVFKKSLSPAAKNSSSSSSPPRSPGRPRIDPSKLKKKVFEVGSAQAMSRPKCASGSGRKRIPFTFEEEEAIIEGSILFAGSHSIWNDIRTHKDFADILINRTNVNIKDKYRNLEKHGRI